MGLWIGVGVLVAAVLIAWLFVPDETVPTRVEGGHVPIPESREETVEPPRLEVRDPTLDERIAALEADGDEDEDEADRIVRVLSEAGEPIVGATVQIGERAFTTDVRGCADFHWPEDERPLEFDVRHPEYVDAVEERSDSGADQVFRLKSGHTIRGWVRFPDGAPVPEATVSAWSDGGTNRPTSVTNERGEFVLTGVPDWKVLVQAASAKTAAGDTQTIAWSAGDPPPEFTVRQSWILLRIHSSGGKPLEQLRVRAANFVEHWGRTVRSEFVGDRNAYRRFHSPEYGTKFYVIARGHRVREVRVPPATKHAKLTEIRVELEPLPARSIYLRVKDADDWPAGWITASWLDDEGDSIREWSLSAKLAAVNDLPPEEVRLRVADELQKLLFREIRVVPSGQTIDITLPAGAQLVVPWHEDMEGNVGVVIKRVEDDLYVPLKRNRKSGNLVSSSRVPPGHYEAQMVRYEWKPPPAKSGTTVLRTTKFVIEPGRYHVVEWGASK